MRNTTLLAICWALLCSASHADNPIVQTLFTADPAPMVHDGAVYLYTSHDEDVLVKNFFTMNDWRCYSSTDMVNWTDHGAIASIKTFKWAKADAWAAQCVERGGKFYLYVPVNQNPKITGQGGMAVGVAVSDSPTGPFQDALGKPLVFDGWGDIDPTVFIDDGQAYLAWGNPTYKWVRLNADMISYDKNVGENGIFRHPMTVKAFGKRSKKDRDTAYEEGPWLYRRGKRYYLFHAGGPVPEHLAYSTGPSPEGPWSYAGVIMKTQGSSFTNHGGVIDFKGKSYLFYHSGALPDGGGFHRSVCVDELKFNPDGSVVPMDMTEEGVAQVSHLSPYATVQAETICWTEGVKTEPCSEGGMSVCGINHDDYIKVKGVDFASGASKFGARVASSRRGGKIELRLDGADGKLIGVCPVPTTGDNQQWESISCDVDNSTGVHDLYLVFTGGDGDLFKLNWWRFKSK